MNDIVCCPNPDEAVIKADERIMKIRKILYYCLYFELLNCILKTYCFSLLTGMLCLIAVWIVYLAYATLHFCQALILAIAAIMDLVMAVGARKAVYSYSRDSFVQITYWFVIVYAIVKFVGSSLIYLMLKEEFEN
jgi:hypothetical protein